MTVGKFDRGFRKLIAWQEAHAMTLAIYRATKSFPSDERYGITSQLRRASSSVDAQIAEGSRMNTNAHRRIYYERAYASAAEVDNFLELSHDLGYLNAEQYEMLLRRVNRTSFLLQKLIQSLAIHSPALPSLPAIPALPLSQIHR